MAASIDMSALERACGRYTAAEAELRRVLGQQSLDSAWHVDTSTLRAIARETGSSIKREAYKTVYTESVDAYGVLFFASSRIEGEPREGL